MAIRKEERQRAVVKFGTECVVNEAGVDTKRIDSHAERLAVLHEEYDLTIVTSGAKGFGDRRLELAKKEAKTYDKRLRAFLGTAGISRCWEESFERQGIRAGQVLMTHDEMISAHEGPRFRNIMTAAFGAGFVPICNYKDFLSVKSDPHDEIEGIDVYTDNDRFSREIAEIIGADVLILATDPVDGFLDERGEVVRQFHVSRLDTMSAQDFEVREGSSGGIFSKLTEAAKAAKDGRRAFICGGDANFDLVISGEQTATEVVQ
jgi:glutamate 5-kinase